MQTKFPVVILDKNQNSLQIVNNFLQDIHFVENIKLYDNYNHALEEIKMSNPIVICDISDISTELEVFLREIKLYTSKLIVTSTNYSTDTIVKALRSGAKEFLPKPLIKEHLIKALTKFVDMHEDNADNSKVISVYSNKGGIGKTTVAINLASELAKVTGEKVALVDLNLQLGDISTFLNLNPPFDVSYVIRNLLGKNSSVLIQAFEQYKNSSLYVLADPVYIEQSESITPIELENLFKTLKQTFSYIVIDMSANIDKNTLKILDNSDFILFTTIVNIPAIRNTQRCLNLFRSRNYPKEKIKIILNRYMDNCEIKIEDIENTLGEKIYWKLPNNYFTIMEAINKGSVISNINPSSNIVNSFRDFATKLSDEIIEQSILKY